MNMQGYYGNQMGFGFNMMPQNQYTKWNQAIQIKEVENFFGQFLEPHLVPDLKLNSQVMQGNGNVDIMKSRPNVLKEALSQAASDEKIRMPAQTEDYIERSFAKCIDQKERDFMHSTLKRLFSCWRQNDQFLERKWGQLPSPMLPRENQITFEMYNYQLLISKAGTTMILNPQPQVQLAQTTRHPIQYVQQGYMAPQIKAMPPKQIIPDQAPLSQEELKKRKQRERKFLNEESFNGQKSRTSSNGQVIQETMTSKGGKKRRALLQTACDFQSSTSLEQHLQSKLIGKATFDKAIVGTCVKLEKGYFRLNSAADPAEVRPEHILKKTLKLLIRKWKEEQTSYKYIDEQFRSMRQDMTVQRIQNEFCLKVYETHARIALECNDLDQFNQCQTQVFYLYNMGIKGKDNSVEFLAYKIIYFIFNDLQAETIKVMKKLTQEQKQRPEIKNALAIRDSLSCNNYGKFFQLYLAAPKMGKYLIDSFLDKHRTIFLEQFLIACGPTSLQVSYLTLLMAFDDESECLAFLKGIKCSLKDGDKTLVCRENIAVLREAPRKTKRFEP